MDPNTEKVSGPVDPNTENACKPTCQMNSSLKEAAPQAFRDRLRGELVLSRDEG
jgi:hypothetical protein